MSGRRTRSWGSTQERVGSRLGTSLGSAHARTQWSCPFGRRLRAGSQTAPRATLTRRSPQNSLIVLVQTGDPVLLDVCLNSAGSALRLFTPLIRHERIEKHRPFKEGGELSLGGRCLRGR